MYWAHIREFDYDSEEVILDLTSYYVTFHKTQLSLSSLWGMNKIKNNHDNHSNNNNRCIGWNNSSYNVSVTLLALF